MERISSVIFYKIEKAIKTYRQLAHRSLRKSGLRITVDQWLTLSLLGDSPFLSQKELAVLMFKDEASITRIIGLLERAGYVQRNDHKSDGRRSSFGLTSGGKKILKKAGAVVTKYRRKALKGVSPEMLLCTESALQTIIDNCDENKKD
jgi:MarR family transcriptional regulator for hemolysin